MFHNTKRNIDLCFKIHSERLKQDFLNHADRSRYEPEFDREHLQYLDRLNSEADHWITREKTRIVDPGTDKVCKLTEGQKLGVARLKQESADHLSNAETLAEAGDFNGSKMAQEKSKKLLDDVAAMREKQTFVPKGDEVCEVCGVRFNLDEDPERAAHHNSNLHKAYVKIREAAAQFRSKVKDPLSIRGSDEGVTKLTQSDREKRDRSGSRSRRGRDRSRDRDKRARSRSRRGDRRDRR